MRTAEEFIASKLAAGPHPFGEVVRRPLPDEERRARAAALAPVIRGLASTDKPQVGHYTDSDVVLDFVSRERAGPAGGAGHVAARTTSCARRSSRWSWTCPSDAPLEEVVGRLKELHAAYRADYQGYYDRNATPDSPAIRGADPAIVLVPGVGMFSFGKDKQTARVAGEFYVNAINVMRGAEAISTYVPIDEAEKFRIEYWALEEAKLARMPEAQAAGHPRRAGHRGRVGHRAGDRRAARRRGRLRRHRGPQPRGRAGGGRPPWAVPTWRSRCRPT